MIPEISTALQMSMQNRFDGGPGKEAGIRRGALVQSIEEQGTKHASQPIVGRNIETFFLSRQHPTAKAAWVVLSLIIRNP